MDYDFSGLCNNQLEVLAKRLESLNKKFIKEYHFALNVINSGIANQRRPEIIAEIESFLDSQVNRSQCLYTEAMNKIQTILRNSV